MRYTRFQDIQPFTRSSSYQVNVSWHYLETAISDLAAAGGGMDMDPDFQRAHVWTEDKQSRYVEFILRGGRSSRDILWNCPTWGNHRKYKTDQPIILVDGKQRLEAVRLFLRGGIKAFGSYFSEYTDKLRLMGTDFVFHVNDLQTRAEVLQWYLDLNSGGVVHSSEEIEKVRKLLESEK